MREIKFRAWDKHGTFINNKTGKAEPHLIENVGISVKPSFYTKQPEWFTENGRLHIPSGSDKFVLMQFTGLYDKDGKEIYEDDIVQDHEIEGVVKWDDEIYRFYLCDDYEYIGLDEFELDGLKVLGNIYENPEFLNQPGKELQEESQ